jgi:hypothetical protein
MRSTNRAAHTRRHLSRHERQRQARVEAFSRRTMTDPILLSPVRLATAELELIDRLVRRDRTAVSTALLAIAGVIAPSAWPSTPPRQRRRSDGRLKRARRTTRPVLASGVRRSQPSPGD